MKILLNILATVFLIPAIFGIVDAHGSLFLGHQISGAIWSDESVALMTIDAGLAIFLILAAESL